MKRDPWPAARLAVAGMRVCVVVTMIDVLLLGAKYEDRVSSYTHDTDVPVLGFLAALIELVVRLDTVLLVTGCVWVLAVSGTAVAFVGWLVQAARHADRPDGRPRRVISVADVVIPHRVVRAVNEASVAGSRSRPAPVGRWWAAVLVTVPLVVCGAFWRLMVLGQQIDSQRMRDTRVFAFLLWSAAAAAVWYSSRLGVQMIRPPPRLQPALERRSMAGFLDIGAPWAGEAPVSRKSCCSAGRGRRGGRDGGGG